MAQLTADETLPLALETSALHMHAGALFLLDHGTGPALDFEALVARVSRGIGAVPAFGCRLREVALGLDRPYLVDAPAFDLRRHIRRISCPSPGRPEQLGALVGDLMGRKLDRELPLWEIWMIEGLEADQVAVLLKVHHCLHDPVSEGGVSEILVDLGSEAPDGIGRDAPRPRQPEGDSDALLALRGAARLLGAPLAAIRLGVAAASRFPTLFSQWREDDGRPRPRSLPQLPFNRDVGPRRQIACANLSLCSVDDIAKHFGVARSDVMLALCGGALRRYLAAGATLPESPIAATVPIWYRTEAEVGDRGPGVTVSLHTDLESPADRLRAIASTTQRAEERSEALGAVELFAMARALPAALSIAVQKGLGSPLGTNLMISHVHAPRQRVFCAGVPVVAIYPIAPLLPGLGLHVTATTYVERLTFTFNADADRVESTQLAEAVAEEFAALEAAASAPRRRARSQSRSRSGPGPGRPAAAAGKQPR